MRKSLEKLTALLGWVGGLEPRENGLDLRRSTCVDMCVYLAGGYRGPQCGQMSVAKI